MYKLLIGALVVVALIYSFIYFQGKNIPSTNFNFLPTSSSEGNTSTNQIIARDLDTPWAIVFLSKEILLVTERSGVVSEINIKTGTKEVISHISSVKEIGEGGLLGITIDPNFESNKYVYFYYTYSENGGETLNRVVRMKYSNKKFTKEEILIDKIPGESNHNGGRIKFGPDKYLYVTTGDAEEPSQAQDTNSLAGKILRATTDGKAAPGNPFGNLIYSYGHRNPQGITWDKDGNLWATEHGRSGLASGLDELNKIESGKNYGWKIIEGNQTKDGMVTPVLNSGATNTWAPAGIAYFDNSLFWGGLRGQTLYKGILNGNKVSVEEHFNKEFGRVREVILGPDNMLYITTSNKDGRGTPKDGDDKIIRIDPKSL